MFYVMCMPKLRPLLAIPLAVFFFGFNMAFLKREIFFNGIEKILYVTYSIRKQRICTKKYRLASFTEIWITNESKDLDNYSIEISGKKESLKLKRAASKNEIKVYARFLKKLLNLKINDSTLNINDLTDHLKAVPLIRPK